jgi:hypothetical protein
LANSPAKARIMMAKANMMVNMMVNAQNTPVMAKASTPTNQEEMAKAKANTPVMAKDAEEDAEVKARAKVPAQMNLLSHVRAVKVNMMVNAPSTMAKVKVNTTNAVVKVNMMKISPSRTSTGHAKTWTRSQRNIAKTLVKFALSPLVPPNSAKRTRTKTSSKNA